MACKPAVNTTEPTKLPDAPAAEAIGHSVRRFVSHHGRTHLDLFSGIGGFALAAASAGFKTIGFSEIEPYACKVLKQNWPDVPNYGDIRNIKGVRADLVTGGFPCQPFSLAGKRGGATDDRHLWPEMCRVISEAGPTWVLGENVPGIISMELDRVLSDLESLGYACWPITVPACAVDARHRRDRLWVMAYSASERERKPADATDAITNGRKTRMESGNGCEPLADATSKQAGRIQQPALPAYAGANGDGSRTPAAWPTEPELGRVADGIPNRPHRLKGLGNAIVPQVAAEILKNLVMANPKVSGHAESEAGQLGKEPNEK